MPGRPGLAGLRPEGGPSAAGIALARRQAGDRAGGGPLRNLSSQPFRRRRLLRLREVAGEGAKARTPAVSLWWRESCPWWR